MARLGGQGALKPDTYKVRERLEAEKNMREKYEKSSSYQFTHVPKTNKKEDEIIADIERQMGGQVTENTLSAEQRDVFKSMCDWVDGHHPGDGGLLTLGGYAGTGKSTLISVLAGHYSEERLAFCAYTGKATSVLRKKFSETGARSSSHTVSTLHALMYRPVVDKDSGAVREWKRREELDYSLIVVDEASMLDEQLYSDLLLYNIPILAVGDHGQLPPVFGKFNLMQKPLLKLEKIHRQAADSPILALSEFVRRTGQVPLYDETTLEVQVLELDQLDAVVGALFSSDGLRHDDVGLLTYTNRSRIELNEKARRARWGARYSEEPLVGDQVICLRNVQGSIFNGMRGTLVRLDKQFETPFHYHGKVLFEDDEIAVEGPICKAQFNRESTFRDYDEYAQATGRRIFGWGSVGLLLDFGYCLTVHKSQGSAFEHAIVVNDPYRSMSFDLKKRALYTAVTRCSKYLVVLQA